jgi:hypothetical protein
MHARNRPDLQRWSPDRFRISVPARSDAPWVRERLSKIVNDDDLSATSSSPPAALASPWPPLPGAEA